MVRTFENRLRQRSLGSRLGPTKALKKPYLQDLRDKISPKKSLNDARTILKNRMQRRIGWDARLLLRRGDKNTSKKTTRVPFIIPIKTVTNDLFRKDIQIKKQISAGVPKPSAVPQGIALQHLSGVNSTGQPSGLGGQALSPIQGFRVEIRNLQPTVTLDDVHELFSSVGSLRLCNLIRPGQAEVVYNIASDALEAANRYNGRELDGRPMTVQVVTPVSPGTTSTRFLSRLGPTLGEGSAIAKSQRQFNSRPNTVSVVRPIEVEADVIRKALFNVTCGNSGSRRPVAFNVSLR